MVVSACFNPDSRVSQVCSGVELSVGRFCRRPIYKELDLGCVTLVKRLLDGRAQAVEGSSIGFHIWRAWRQECKLRMAIVSLLHEALAKPITRGSSRSRWLMASQNTCRQAGPHLSRARARSKALSPSHSRLRYDVRDSLRQRQRWSPSGHHQRAGPHVVPLRVW